MRSPGLAIPAPPSSVWSAIWSLAARNAVGSGPYCSASPCWSLLSRSPGSNTRWRITSVLRLHTDDLRERDGDVVGPAPGYRCPPQLENRRNAPVLRQHSSDRGVVNDVAEPVGADQVAGGVVDRAGRNVHIEGLRIAVPTEDLGDDRGVGRPRR